MFLPFLIRTITVGTGVSPDRLLAEFADYHCRYGITPIPKVLFSILFFVWSARAVGKETLDTDIGEWMLDHPVDHLIQSGYNVIKSFINTHFIFR